MIRVDNAVKSFGNKKALDGISFTAGEGQIVGLLGSNGAGKSTMLKAVAGLLRLDQGLITIDEKTASLSTRGMLTYLPDVDVWYPWMKLSDAIQYMKDMYWDWDDKKAHHLLDFFKLREDSLIQQASKGTRAKMKLLLALSRQAKYLLMDEPFTGIDPFARQQIAQAIVEDFMEEGQTIIITTHEISEVEVMLDEVLFIHEGNLMLTGHVETLKQERNKSLIEILKEEYDHARV
ncbi:MULTISPECIES: ABC transporter ATP-binding protein [Paenibacillus]|uniref:ABC transporter ATP-binding protein n=1 Tax=Paenibacillus radicis (ex Xue et al. 2023) TaxID=2972489 RepID=A0ABT1YBV2_9BACL|nr:ABC transporter ATP-binding protein [Paenibacillus radicis (ex Xue et al. 2023)]MCR8630678.1 ABC transporter ATP-binding protein [Paenibacillus radicis (ex Xue et al. 2023)]